LLIDDKNRLLIPAQFRKKIVPEVDGSLLFVTLKKLPDYGYIPWFYSEDFFRRLVNKHSPPVLTPGRDQLKYTHRTLSLADELEWDSQGRVVLPTKILTPAELGGERCREVTLIGAKDHFELWKRPQWIEYRTKLFEESDAIEDWAQGTMGDSASDSGSRRQRSSEDRSSGRRSSDAPGSERQPGARLDEDN
jgi:DNA-binding transcriptional regulator/RsmH inhibitor MraZ